MKKLWNFFHLTQFQTNVDFGIFFTFIKEGITNKLHHLATRGRSSSWEIPQVGSMRHLVSKSSIW